MAVSRTRPHDDDDDLIVLAPDLNTAYRVPMRLLSPTDGSAALLKSFETYGVYNKNEFYLCTNSIARCCPHGRSCRDVHLQPGVTTADLKGTATHRNVGEGENDPAMEALVNSYPRHIPGHTLEVYDHKTRRAVEVNSGNVIITLGSEEHIKLLAARNAAGRMDGTEAPEPRRMQQCTHFQKRLCLRGASCGFLHVLMAALATAPEKISSTSSSSKAKKEKKPHVNPITPVPPAPVIPYYPGGHPQSSVLVQRQPPSQTPTVATMQLPAVQGFLHHNNPSGHPMPQQFVPPPQTVLPTAGQQQVVYVIPSGWSHSAQPPPQPQYYYVAQQPMYGQHGPAAVPPMGQLPGQHSIMVNMVPEGYVQTGTMQGPMMGNPAPQHGPSRPYYLDL